MFYKKYRKIPYLHKNSNHPISDFKSFIKGIRKLRNTDTLNFKPETKLFIKKILKITCYIHDSFICLCFIINITFTV